MRESVQRERRRRVWGGMDDDRGIVVDGKIRYDRIMIIRVDGECRDIRYQICLPFSYVGILR